MKTNKLLLSKKEQIQKMISLPAIELEAEEADRFIDYMVDESVLKDSARIVRMAKPTKNIRALGLGTGRFLRPGANFSSSDYKDEFTEEKIELVSKKVRGAVVIYDDDLEDNPEGATFKSHIMKMVAAKIAMELDEAFWIGDAQSFAGFDDADIRRLFDGWRYRIRNSQVSGDAYYNAVSGHSTLVTARTVTRWSKDSHQNVVGDIVRPRAGSENGFVYICTTAGSEAAEATQPTWPTTIGDSVTEATRGAVWRCHAYECRLGGKIVEQKTSAPYDWDFKYGRMLRVLPSKFKKAGLANLRLFNSDQVTQDYIDALAARSTALGDAAILGKGPLHYGKVPIIDCPLMPIDMSAAGVVGSGAYADCLLTVKGNLIMGIQRSIKIESQREAADEATYWFYSMRVDTAVENVNACVLMEHLETGLTDTA